MAERARLDTIEDKRTLGIAYQHAAVVLLLLANLVDPDDDEDSEYRFLVDGKYVKYVTVAPGVLPKDDRTFAPVLIPLLPPFPPGDWNEGHVSLDPTAPGRGLFSRIGNNDLPRVEHVWHQTRIDLLELKKVERVRQNIHIVTHPLFDRPVLATFAQFPWEMPYYAAEMAAYQWIHGMGIGPAFLGHITEAGRVTGFLMEHIDNAKAAGPGDLAACQRSLRKLHALGILHGDINKHNFLVRGGEVVLVDFETAERTEDEGELEKECRRLEASLGDPSTRGGPGVPVVGEQCPRRCGCSWVRGFNSEFKPTNIPAWARGLHSAETTWRTPLPLPKMPRLRVKKVYGSKKEE